MEKEIAIGILKTHNRWRRGEDDEPKLKPSDIGKAIDLAIKVMEQQPNKETFMKEAEAYSLEQWSLDKWTAEEVDRYNEGAQWAFDQLNQNINQPKGVK